MGEAAEYLMGEEAEGTRRTLRFIFSVACERVFPSRRVVGGNAIGNGYWYTLSPQDGQSGAPWGAPCSPADAAKILAEMQALIEADAPISSEHVPYADALAYMQIAGQHVALNLLKKRVPLGGTVAVKSCCVASTRHLRLSLFPLLPSTGALKVPFTVEAYAEGGLILVQGQKLVAVHHLLTLGIHSSIPRYGMFAALSAMGYLAELSTPLVNGRWMLSVTTGTGDAVYLANGIAMMVIFFFCRIVAGAFYLYEMFVLVPRHAPPLLSDMGIQGRVIPPLTLAFYALNIYWMYKIVKGALKALGVTSSKKSD